MLVTTPGTVTLDEICSPKAIDPALAGPALRIQNSQVLILTIVVHRTFDANSRWHRLCRRDRRQDLCRKRNHKAYEHSDNHGNGQVHVRTYLCDLGFRDFVDLPR